MSQCVIKIGLVNDKSCVLTLGCDSILVVVASFIHLLLRAMVFCVRPQEPQYDIEALFPFMAGVMSGELEPSPIPVEDHPEVVAPQSKLELVETWRLILCPVTVWNP